MKFRNNQSGYVIYIVIVILFILSTYTMTIIYANNRRILPVIKKLNTLQASVCAYSGLHLMQAFTSGYDGHDIHSEFEILTKDLDNSGTMIISSRHDAGWLKVKSIGIRLKDTVRLEGILGQSPPEYTDNVLNVFENPGNLVVSDRARVFGNIGTNGKGAVIKGSGLFSGSVFRLDEVKYDPQSFNDEFNYAENVFIERKAIKYLPDSLLPVKPEEFTESVAQKKGDIFIEKNLHLNKEYDFYLKTLWIDGNLVIDQDAKIENITAYITGNTYISSRATIAIGSIICFGNVRIMKQANIRMNIMCAETLAVSGDANVEYPSVLYSSQFAGQETGKTNPVLLITDNVRIVGTILIGMGAKSSLQPRAYISGRSSFEGFLFSPFPVSLNGKISGNISVNKLIYEKPGCVYDGWLMEVTLTHSDISEMVIPLVFPENCQTQYLTVSRNVGTE